MRQIGVVQPSGRTQARGTCATAQLRSRQVINDVGGEASVQNE
jgi:hypothetical protein